MTESYVKSPDSPIVPEAIADQTTTTLTVSVVVYQLDEPVLQETLTSLVAAAYVAYEQAALAHLRLYLVDNEPSGANRPALEKLLSRCQRQFSELPMNTHLLSGHGNIGYGRGHNLALHHSAALEKTPASGVYLILNPDVTLEADSLLQGLRWLANHEESVAVAPAIEERDGHLASACKRYPSMLDFLLRGFAPSWIKQRFAKRLARYDMHDLPSDQPSPDIPIISGCFMLFRQSALSSLDGFDPAYFLYFEDFDLSMRAHRLGTLTYLPQMRIHHLGGHSARKGLKHIAMFGRSALRFFSTHGWRWT